MQFVWGRQRGKVGEWGQKTRRFNSSAAGHLQQDQNILFTYITWQEVEQDTTRLGYWAVCSEQSWGKFFWDIFLRGYAVQVDIMNLKDV
jgi:hypothetical protein